MTPVRGADAVFLLPAFSSKIVHLNMQNSRAPRSHFVFCVCFGLFYTIFVVACFSVYFLRHVRQTKNMFEKPQTHCSGGFLAQDPLTM